MRRARAGQTFPLRSHPPLGVLSEVQPGLRWGTKMPSVRAVECISSTAIVSASSGEWYTLLCHYLGLTFIAFINGFVNEKRNRSLFHVRDEAKFTARMSHEIRTPLNGVLGMMKELARDPGLSATQRALIDGMEVGFPCPLTTDLPFIAAHGPPSWMALSFNTVTFTGGGGGVTW